MRGATLAVLLLPFLAFGEEAYVPPPRNVDDILAVLGQYKPDPEAVRKRTETANRQPPATDDKQALAQFYLERSRARGALGQISGRIDDLRLAAQYAKGTMSGKPHGARRNPVAARAQEEGDEGRILQELSIAESGGGNFLNAVNAREEMLKDMQAQSRPRGGILLSGFLGLANMNATLGDLATAHQHLSEAEAVFQRLRQSPGWEEYGSNWTAGMERSRGHLYASEGQYAAAEASYRKAVQAMDAGSADNLQRFKSGERATPPGRYLATRNGDQLNLAWALAQQGRLAEAEAAARDALKKNLSFFGRYAGPSAQSLFSLANILSEQGRFREAALLAAAAVEVYEKGDAAPESLALANARRAHAAALVAQRKWREALAVYERMQEGLARDPLIVRQFGRGDLDWGYALVQTGEAARAAAMLGELGDTLEKRLGDNDRGVAEARGYHAIALAANGERAAALAEFRRAVPVLIENARAEESPDAGATGRWLRLTNVLEAYIDLLSSEPEGAVEAFRIADIARGSSVQRALSLSAARGAARDPALAELARREQDAQHRIGVLSDLLSRLLAAPPEQQLAKIIGDVRRDLDALRAEHTGLRRDIERRFPEYAQLTDPKPVTLAQAQAALLPGEALLALYVGPARTYIWAVPQSGAPAFAVASLGRAEVESAVAKIRETLDVGDVPLLRMPPFRFSTAYALYSALLAPVEAAWKDATSLLVVPHGALGQLPFAVLTSAPFELKPGGGALFAGNRDAPWLIKRAALTQLPSVGTLATLRRAAAAQPGRREFIGFGDPVFSKAQLSRAAGALRGVRLRGSDNANSATLAELAPLPDTSEEILRIAEVLHADPGEDVYLHERASESLVKKMDLAHRRIVAFATHGLIPGDLNGLTQPALALSAPDVAGGEDDGLLTMEEIIGLRLDADWVVLSACNTGAGEGAGGEAVSGLGRAFFYAGARALLVSNWPVETTSARILTTGVFRRQAADPKLSRAEALRRAMLDLLQGREGDGPGYTYAHPLFWAPFSLVGEGAAR
ncbi:MAG TPA: CHAT domain-containing protein [Burkholderiales bacterium]|nr:CHAT domain-containing protein [Burkholderiales bacterium]